MIRSLARVTWLLGAIAAAAVALYWAQYLAFGDCDDAYARTDRYQRFCDGAGIGARPGVVALVGAGLLACALVPWALSVRGRLSMLQGIGWQLVAGALLCATPFMVKSGLQGAALGADLPELPLGAAFVLGVAAILVGRRAA